MEDDGVCCFFALGSVTETGAVGGSSYKHTAERGSCLLVLLEKSTRSEYGHYKQTCTDILSQEYGRRMRTRWRFAAGRVSPQAELRSSDMIHNSSSRQDDNVVET